MERDWISGSELINERQILQTDLIEYIKNGLTPYNQFKTPIPCPRYAHVLNKGVERVHKSNPIFQIINNPKNLEKNIRIVLEKIQMDDVENRTVYVCCSQAGDFDTSTSDTLQSFINESIIPELQAELEEFFEFKPQGKNDDLHCLESLQKPEPASQKVVSRCEIKNIMDLKPVLYRYLQGDDDQIVMIRKKDPYMASWEFFSMPKRNFEKTELFKLLENAIFKGEDVDQIFP